MLKSPSGSSSSARQMPLRPLPKTLSKSSCSSVASSSQNKSKTLSKARSGLQPSRSILFTTMIGVRPSSKAFFVTKRVWAMGPSNASTTRRTPSTVPKTRSTWPPKSACPGVSTMFTRYPLYITLVFLERMVMPRSRSRLSESITRSTISSPSWKVPHCLRSWFTRVVLPWSTWAMMATFLIFD